MAALTSPKPERPPFRTGPDVSSAPQRVTVRAVLFALLLIVANDYWIVQLEVIRYSFATYAAPFYNCIFILLVVTVANQLVRRISPRLAFSRIELLTIYAMLSIASAVLSHNMMEILVSLMGYAHFFKTPENQWDTLFVHRLPNWLTVSDPTALRGFYYGNTSLYLPMHYRPWIVPALSWSVFCTALLFTMLCLNSILRKQWTDSERLTFPVVMLPLEMTNESAPLLKNRSMWIGFAIAGFLTFIAGLNYLYPSVPCLQITRQNVGQYIVNQPWKAMGGITVGFYFWAIGIAFLMPLDLSFSCWVFHWLFKMELVASEAFGLNDLKVPGGGFDTSYPFAVSQAYGAYLGFFLMSMWAGRHYIARVLRTAFLKTGEEDESREALSYRAAILGAAVGFAFLAIFCYKMGMTPWVIVVFFTFYFIFAVIVSRIRAELGFPTHDMHMMGPQHMIMTTAGTQNLGAQNLVGFSLFFWFNRTYASHPSPHQLEALKLSERSNGTARQMFVALVIASVVAMPIGFWMLLHNYYQRGGATANMEIWALGMGRECWSALGNWLKQPQPPNTTSMAFVGVGLAGSILLGWMRVRFFGFPLHPLAYAMANSWGVAQLWMPLFIGSTAKFVILRYGGLRTYRRALPFFLGLILGEITIGSMWTLLGIALGIPTYGFWPGRYS